MLEAATILQSPPPQHSKVRALLLAAGKEVTKGAETPAPKVVPLPAQTFIPFKTLAMVCANFTIMTPTRLTGALRPVLGWKISLPPSYFRFGRQSNTRYCHGYAFFPQMLD